MPFIYISLERVKKLFLRLWNSWKSQWWQKHGTFQEWPDYQNDFKRLSPTHPGGQKEPTTTSKEPQVSLASVKVRIFDSTIRKTGKMAPIGREFQISMLTKKKQSHISHFLKIASRDPKDFCENICGLMRQRLNFLEDLSSSKLFFKLTQHFIKWTVKHAAGGVMAHGCFAASGPGQLAIIDWTMNFAVHQKVQQNMNKMTKQTNEDFYMPYSKVGLICNCDPS